MENTKLSDENKKQLMYCIKIGLAKQLFKENYISEQQYLDLIHKLKK